MADTQTEKDQVNGDADLKEKTEKEGETKVVENGDDTISDLESKIIQQIEYYFGDCNLPKDKFLQQQIKLDDGWVPLDVMLKFNRLAKLSTDESVISSSLKKSESGLMEVSEDGKKIRRCPTHALPEMNEARRQELMHRSLYVKGFPIEDTEVDTLLEYFGNHAKIDQVVIRKQHDKAAKKWLFKGSVFAVFPSKEEAEKFLKIENLKYGDTELIVKWQKDYIEDKRNQRLLAKLENQTKKRKQKEDVNENEGEEEEKDSLAKGAALYFSNCSKEVTREEIKSKIEEFGIAVAYLYFNKGDEEGWVRLQEADSAAEVIKNLKDGKLELKDSSIDVKALEGEEETKFLAKVKDDMTKRRNHHKHFGKKSRGGSGGGNWRKRRGSPHEYEKNKKTKTEKAD
ncbi:la autoantigen-like [Lycorma delicatula]|uniref:la autoantigen-like n=1 Tax=Lycorma delicatula TaxID=130591 RepID=UPI003F518ACA